MTVLNGGRKMSNIFFENVHEALPFHPYISPDSRNFNYIPHYHAEFEIVRVLSGSISITKNGVRHILSAEDFLLIFPYEIHDFSSECVNRVHVVKLYVPEYFRYSCKRCVISPSSPLHAEIKSIFKHISEEFSKKENGYEFAINMYLSKCLTLIVRNLDLQYISDDSKNMDKLALLNSVNDYLELHYNEKISLDDIASYCGYSKYYFAHIFKQITSVSFVEFMTVFRLKKSKELLKISGKKVTDIAFECGFHSLRSFNRSFKKYYSTTPGQYMSVSSKPRL